MRASQSVPFSLLIKSPLWLILQPTFANLLSLK
jgi:hypothetical protein